ncbi:MAG: amino acid adenylation domain-containing protein [Gemmatimonadetes bacterium]|nr:amino acid adenylation domain-containing protein [Gemmatimonadota bacterium]
MNLAALVAQLRELGVTLWLEGDRLRFAAPPGRLTPELREAMKQHRQELVELLATAAGAEVAALPPADRNGPLPLSFAQQRLWLLDQMVPDRGVYNMATAVRLVGPLDRPALERAVLEVQRRHESLRTTFQLDAGRPVQRIAGDGVPAMVLDWSAEVGTPGLGGGRLVDERLVALASESYRQTFDLARGPLFRATIVVLGPEEHALLLACHHIVSDGISEQIVFGELAVLYAAFAAGRESPLAPLARQYADFASWQRGQQAGGELERQLEYWTRRLAGAPAMLELATDRKRPAVRTFHGATAPFALSAETSRAIDGFARDHGATPFMALLATFGALLQRFARQDDILVGSPLAGRDRSELEPMVGFFVNTLVLRIELTGQPTGRDLLARVRETVLGAFGHADVPVEQVVEALRIPRRLDANPLFQVMFGLEPPAGPPAPFGTCRVEPIGFQGSVAKFDLTWSMAPTATGYAGVVEYNTNLFDRTTIDRMIEVFRALADGMARRPTVPIAELPLLDPAARSTLLALGQGSSSRYPEDPAPRLFEAWVRRCPDAIAVEYDGVEVTYRELNARANRLARFLRARGIGPDVPVALCLPRGVDLIVAMLGTLKAGGAYVPLDPEHPAPRQRHVLADTGAPLVLTTEALADSLGVDIASRRFRLDADWDQVAGELPDDLEPITGPEHLAYVIYTSGSTGKPKGVAVPLRAINRLVFETNYVDLAPADRVAQAASATFDAATFEIWGALLHGARVVGIPRDVSLDPARLVATLRERQVTILFLTTALFNQVARLIPDGFHHLRYLLFGGEAVDPKWVRAVLEAGGPTQLLHVYGPTECTTFATWWPVTEVSPDATTVPIGHPIANTVAHVLDAKREPVPLGVPGELYLGGDGLAREYLNQPEQTAARFVPNPFGPGRLYRTGDVVRRRPDGAIEFLGRVDFQVKIRGFRVELGEIEAALLEIPGIHEAVVMVREDVPGDRRLVGYYAADPSVAPASLRTTLRDRLPGYMVPGALVPMPSLPLNVSGKVDRAALPPPDHRVEAEPAVGPRTDLEGTVAAIWREVLRLDEVSVTDNFFDVGGHSLLLIELHRRLLETFPEQVTVVQLFANPTVESQARLLAGGRPAAPTPLSVARTRRAAIAGSPADEPIAIVGMAGRFPGAADIEAFWENLKGGVESITRFSEQELIAAGWPQEVVRRPDFVSARGVLDGVELFDAGFFGYSAREADLTDPQQRLFLECCHEGLERAGYDPARFDGPIGVFGGCGPNAYAEHLRGHPAVLAVGAMQFLLASDRTFLATRASYKLDLRGPSLNVQTACSTSLVAVHVACQSLLRRESDLALAGGAAVSVPTVDGYFYQEDGILSPDGRCRPFDADARGTVGGNGVAVVVLQRLSDAVRDGATIHAVIRGSAINNDGSNKVGFTAPSVEGQAEAIATALAAAGVEPETIGYVETHGTATTLGDPIEIEALTAAHGGGVPGRCAIGSVKSNIGHLDSAAGVAALIKTALCLEHGTLVPSLHYSRPNPRIDFAGSPFAVSTETRAWPVDRGRLRRAGVSSFGIGGTNAHAVLEEPPVRAPSTPGRSRQILTLSAKTPAALEAASDRLATFLESHRGESLADVAYTLQIGRSEYAHRRSVVAVDATEAISGLRDPRHRASTTGQARGRRGVVFMFPGQGAQFVGMGRELYDAEPIVRATIDECAALTTARAGFDLRHALYPSDGSTSETEARLRRTLAAQLGLFSVELALARLWMTWGVRPVACIGHSIGEYVAACVAGVLSLPDALELVLVRGRLMEQAPAGAMIAVPLAETALAPRLGDDLWLAAVNGPEMCVVSGAEARIAAFADQLRREGVESRPLLTAGAFHSGLMDAVKAPLAAAAAAIPHHPPAIPYLSNVTGTWAGPEISDPEYWANHLRGTVRFDPGIATLLDFGAAAFLEVGPGRTLSSLVRRRATAAAEVLVVPSLPSTPDAGGPPETIDHVLGRLWAAGTPVEWREYHAGESRRRVPLPTYPFERQRHWIEGTGVAVSAPVATDRRADVRDWFYVPTWTRTAPLQSIRGRFDDCWLVFADRRGVARGVADRLEADGATIVTVRPGEAYRRAGERDFVLRPGDSAGYQTLARALAETGIVPSRLLHAWALDATDAPRATDLSSGFDSLLDTLRALEPWARSTTLEGLILTCQVHAVTGIEDLRPANAAVQGLCQVAGQESPNVRLGTVDLEWPLPEGTDRDDVITRLADEARAPVATAPTAYRGRARWTLRFDPLPLDPVGPATRLRERGIYVITGGFGGVGLALAHHLAERYRARLALIGRTPLPPRDEWPRWRDRQGADAVTARRIRAVEALEAAGAEVLPLGADVADVVQLQAAFDEIGRRFGAPHGVIHGAGTTGGPSIAPIPELTVEACRAQFHPKMDGTLALAAVLGDTPLDFCLLTSSLSTVLGGLEFAAYAAANHVEDALADQRSLAARGPWISVNWDGWHLGEEPVDPSARGAGRFAMTRAEAADAFERIVGQARLSRVVVSTGDLSSRAFAPVAATTEPASAPPTHQRPQLSTTFVAPRDDLERAIAATWESVLGVSPIGVDDDFFEMGGDSLVAVQLMFRLSNELSVRLTTRHLFTLPTVAGLAVTVRASQNEQGAAADVLAMIDGLSDEEVQRLLAETDPDGTPGMP